jgi:nitrite reductase (NO-forming)
VEPTRRPGPAEARPISLSPRGRRPRLDRGGDRRVTFAGVVVAAVLVATALLSLALPEGSRLGTWLPLHLALAGGAGTAIAALLPFFTTTLVVAPPAPLELRAGAIVLVAGGAAAIAIGHAGGEDRVATVGGVAYLLGLLVVAIVAFVPVRGAFGPRRRLVERAYAVALLDVAIGAALATGFLGREDAFLARWASLKPAHAWLNLLGFVTLVIAATLVHLAPTVVGARIRPRRAALVAVAALAVAAPLVALGTAVGSIGLARVGAIVAAVGAGSLAVHGLEVRRERASWTSDRDWHALTDGSLAAAPFWLLVATVIAAVRLLATDDPVGAWSFASLGGPLVAGFAVQVLVGAWTHLVPPIGPGHPIQHARRRAILGRLGRARLVAWNAAVAVLTVAALAAQQSGGTAGQGSPEGTAGAVATAAAAALGALAALSLGLFGSAMASRVRDGGADPAKPGSPSPA